MGEVETNNMLAQTLPSRQRFFGRSFSGLGSRSAGAVEACAAWAIVVASHSFSAQYSVARMGSGRSQSLFRTSIQWTQSVGDFLRQAQASLEDFTSDVSETTSTTLVNGLEPLGRESLTQTFNVLIFGQSAWTRNVLLTGEIRHDEVCIETADLDHPSDKALALLLLSQFEDTIRKICVSNSLETPLAELAVVSVRDLEQIWNWNSTVPRGIDNVCIHELFMHRAQQHPDRLAVEAHDGKLTYRELDVLSTRLAQALLQQNVAPGGIVVVLIEKSQWVPVAQVAVMKCGCASTILDASFPLPRLHSLSELVQATAILTSPECAQIARMLNIDRPLLLLSDSDAQKWPSETPASLPAVDPMARLYIVFTSGSTGTPKGAVISHANYASATATQQEKLDFREFDRVFDFASYAFDAAWCNVIHALTIGGCLCVPSEEERRGDLAGALRKYRVNYAVLTPSVAWFPASALPNSLRTIHFGGEPLKVATVKELSVRSTIINAYGPAECSTVSTAMVTDPDDERDPAIGTGLGVCTWVVKSDGSDLTPIGEIGELWLEGPIIGQGYISDPAKTADTFFDDAPWLRRGCPNLAGKHGHVGRRGRLYRSGDMVRYRADGRLDFVGRKDSQIKIRGQRVEMEEIEYHLQRAFTDEVGDTDIRIVADMVTPEGSGTPALISFLFSLANPRPPPASTQLEVDKILHEHLSGIEERLRKLIPSYMIPSAFFTIPNVPMTHTGKVDRRQLRKEGATMYRRQLNARIAVAEVFVGSEIETTLRDIWSEVLNLPVQAIGPESVFIRLGGDSIAAMKVASRCRSRNIAIRVSDILKQPNLSALAKVAEKHCPSLLLSEPPVKPFALLGGDVDHRARSQAARACDINVGDIEDIYPCTALQAGLLAETLQRPGDNVLTESLEFKPDIDVARFRAAWQTIVGLHPILRTRVVDLVQHGLVQVVVRHERCGGAEDVTAQDLGLGTVLLSYTISESSFSWSIHHALYDGWSMSLIFDSLTRVYRSEPVPVVWPYQMFIKHIQGCDTAKAEEFWRSQFTDCRAQAFPELPSRTYKPTCDRSLRLDITSILTNGHSLTSNEHPITSDEDPVAFNGDSTIATRIRLAWAILVSTVTGSPDASFGSTVLGRHDVPHIEDMTGPTFATVPLRIPVDRSKSVKDLLQQVQRQAADMMPFEHFGLQRIRRASEESEQACQFQSHVVIQPASQYNPQGTLFEPGSIQTEAGSIDNLKHYAICLEFILEPNGVRLHANFDSSVIAPHRFQRLVNRLANILRQLASPDLQAQPLSRLDTSSLDDHRQIQSWNSTTLDKTDCTIHEIFESVATQQPEAPAICAWDGELTYRELSTASTRVAHVILRSGLGQIGQRIIPLFFEKSKWMPVAQLAVMKANGTSVGLDVTLPSGRLQTIMNQVKPQIILASAEQEQRARQLAPAMAQIIVVDEALIRKSERPDDPQLPIVEADAWLYVVFTSGSTGTPKGAIISHSNYASAFEHGRSVMRFGPHSRTFDFVSYAFDVSWLNLLHTLCAGGCLCIPSQFEIRNEPKEAVARRRANIAFITPTIDKLLRGAEELEVVHFGGEILTHDEIDYWKDRAQIYHSYGPSECTPIVITHMLDPERRPVILGKGVGVRTWIVEPDGGTALTAVGDVGELWLEGPLVGQGYLNDPEQTEAHFVQEPEWLIRCGRSSADLQGRLYRTGDLVSYEEDGSLRFVGRKDSQVKIRGQRVEVEEIEHHLSHIVDATTASQVIVGIVHPCNSPDAILVAFVRPSDTTIIAGTPEAQSYAQELAASFQGRLSGTLPSYMIPQGLMIVNDIPVTTSGKIDRKKLREAAASMGRDDLLKSNHVSLRPAKTPQEKRLHEIVARVLSHDGGTFGMHHGFVQLGGDSISAMRLVRVARENGLSFTVADVLTKTRIADLLTGGASPDCDQDGKSEPFALLALNHPHGFVQDEILRSIKPGHGELVDILPATDMQSTYLRDNLRVPRRSWFYNYIDFDHTLNEHRLIDSCVQLVARCDIYRTAFVHSVETFYLAIFDSWNPTVDIIADVDCVETTFNDVINEELRSAIPLGTPLIQFKLIHGRTREARFVFGMSHAIYDAISVGHTIQILTDLYDGSIPPPNPDFRNYLTHVHSHKHESYAYWRELLRDSSMTKVLTVCPTTSDNSDGPPTILTRTIQPAPRDSSSTLTPASLFTAACASALSRATDSADVVFGRVVSGRAAVPPSVADAVGPCLNRLPVRVRFPPSQSRAVCRAAVQRQFVESLAHETTGIADLVRNCTDWSLPSGADEEKEEEGVGADRRLPRDFFGCWVQYQNVDESFPVRIPGAVGGLRHHDAEADESPVAPDYLEIFAAPCDKSGNLVIKVVAGPGHQGDVVRRLLDDVCDDLLRDDDLA